MTLAVAPATVGALLTALAFGLAADAVTVTPEPPARQASSTPATAEPAMASAPKPVRRAKSACRLIVGWPDCALKPKPEPPQPVPAPQPAPAQPGPEGPSQGCDRACLVERRANTPAERPAPQPDEPDWPDDEDGIDLGTLTPPPGE